MSEDWAIKIEHLSKVYKIFDKPTDRVKEAFNPFRKRYSRDFYALNDVSLTIKKGETVGIIGKNGAGKSTILKIITGVLTPTSGSVQVNGRIASLLELGAGFNPEMTGIENIYLNGTIMGYSKEEMEDRLQDIIDFADIGEFIHQPVKMYSSGMFARLAFAVNAFVEPDILIVDEALSVGDVGFQTKCYRKFAELRESGVTILLVTHDLTSILQFCDYAVFLANGKKFGEGSPKEIVDLYKQFLSNETDNQIRNNNHATETDDDNSKTHLKLWKSNYKINESLLEYGDKVLEFMDFKITNRYGEIVSVIKNFEDVTITGKVIAHQDVDEPIFAFSIKDVKGNELAGFNTILKKYPVGKLKAGCIYDISFKQNIPLRAGKYTLSLGCTKYINDDLHVYHRLYDVLIMDIISNVNTAGLVHINSEISVVERK